MNFNRVAKKSVVGAFIIMVMFASIIITSLQPLSAKSSQNQPAWNSSVTDVSGQFDTMVEDNLKEPIASPSFLTADTEIKVIVRLNDDVSVLDRYLAGSKTNSISQFAQSAEGKSHAETLLNKQTKLQNQLADSFGKDISFKYNYTTITHGFSATIKYGDLNRLRTYSKKIKDVSISEFYSVPDIAVSNPVVIDELTGIYDGSATGYDGSGTIVAVLDTGLDYFHRAFNVMPTSSNLALTKNDVSNVIDISSINSHSKYGNIRQLTADDVYVNEKIPLAFDYADEDPDVYPDQMHGTHVAGIVAGNDEEFTGVAPNAQLAIFKVFGNEIAGSYSVDALAAVSDAVLFGVDVINMSLGSSGGFTEEGDDITNEIYEGVTKSGITLCVAAGNAGSNAQGGGYGSNLANSPDSSTMSSPATYKSAIAVASISGRKTEYIVANNSQSIYLTTMAATGQEKVPFVSRLLEREGADEIEIPYEVIPGIGLSSDYANISVSGKIAVVKRGEITFRQKVYTAINRGAKGVIIYNNVAGTITATIGELTDAAAGFISKDDGEVLAQTKSGTIKLSKDFLGGPFMSDFSSWGVSPDLELKPEITAHGGDILSADIGKYNPSTGYTEGTSTISGTSMASPNVAGIMTLARQYVKEHYPNLTQIELAEMVSRLVMSTAIMVRNEEGNPYSPRLQGAGMADITSVINTNAYIYVAGSDRTKLSLGDDKQKTGVYELSFLVRNTSSSAVSYVVDPNTFTESLNRDGKTVAQKAFMLQDTSYSVSVSSNVSYNQSSKLLTIGGYRTADVKITVTLGAEGKKYLNESFENGMFVEGFVVLRSTANSLTERIDLSMPYLAYYGDWNDAPFFDISVFEKEEQLRNTAIKEDDKIKHQVHANQVIGIVGTSGYTGPLGEYVFQTENESDVPAPVEDKIAISANYTSFVAVGALYAGLLRSTRTMDVVLSNADTGREIDRFSHEYLPKGLSPDNQGSPAYVNVGVSVENYGLADNAKYNIQFVAYPDYPNAETAKNNTYNVPFYVDSDAPRLVENGISVRTTGTGVNKRYFLDLQIYDNHYIQALNMGTYSSFNGTYLYDMETFSDYYIPISSQRNSVTTYSHDITQYWDTILANGEKLYIEMVDYALNVRQLFVQLPREQTQGMTFKTSLDGDAITERDININQAFDLKTILYTTNVYAENWKFGLDWVSSNPSVVRVSDGEIVGVSQGSATVTVTDKQGLSASITINVSETSAKPITLESITLNSSAVTLMVGETYQIKAKANPWSVSPKLTAVSSNENVVKILESVGNTFTILINEYSAAPTYIRVQAEGSLVYGELVVSVKYPYEIEGSVLKKYHGYGDQNGLVEIPSNLGIEIIYTEAFAALPLSKVVIPEGVKTIDALAFALSTVEEVVLPQSLETIGVGAFSQCAYLNNINLDNVKTINNSAFYSSGLTEAILTNTTFIGSYAFTSNVYLERAEIPNAMFIGYAAFAGCNTLSDIVFPLSGATLADFSFSTLPALKSIELNTYKLGAYVFSFCTNLETVRFNNSVSVGQAAFYGCESLKNVTFVNGATSIGSGAFEQTGLEVFRLPEGLRTIGQRVFAGCLELREIILPATARLSTIGDPFPVLNYGDLPLDNNLFADCANVVSFTVEEGNPYLSSMPIEVGGTVHMLTDKAQESILLVPYGYEFVSNVYTVPNGIKYIGAYSFSGTSLKGLNTNEVIKIGNNAFLYCAKLETITFGSAIEYIGEGAFRDTANLRVFDLFVASNGTAKTPNLWHIGNYAFSTAGMANITLTKGTLKLPSSVTHVGNYAFYQRADITLADLSTSGLTTISSFTFGGCVSLTSVVFPTNVHTIGSGAFYNTSLQGSIVLPSSVTHVAEYAFMDTAISSINLGGVTSISEQVFANCPNLSEVIGMENVTYIGVGAFYSCTALTNLDLSSAIIIDGYAFVNTSLVQIDAPEATYLGYWLMTMLESTGTMFDNYTLRSVNAPKAVTVDDYAFAGCRAVEDVNIPSAQYIGLYAFGYNNSLHTIYMPNVEYIGASAFFGVGLHVQDGIELDIGKATYVGNSAFRQSRVTSVTLSAELVWLGESAFAQTYWLEEIVIPEQNKLYFTDGSALYSYVNGGLQLEIFIWESGVDYSVDTGSGTKNVYTVLDDTMRIGAEAFAYIDFLDEIHLSRNLKHIGNEAFYATTISTFYFYSPSAPEIEAYYYNEYDGTQLVQDFGLQHFTFTNADDAPMLIFYPNNGQGYEDFIYKHYFNLIMKNPALDVMQDLTVNVINAIARIPATITMAEVPSIRTAYANYMMLSSSQRAMITAADRTKLTEANKQADVVELNYLIDSISQGNVLENQQQIEAAMELYNKLSDEQKAQLQDVDRLLSANNQLQEIINPKPPEEPANLTWLFVLLGVLGGLALLGGAAFFLYKKGILFNKAGK